MAGYGPPPGPYVGFQPNAQPIGFEMHHAPYPPHENRTGYPPPPSQDLYRPSTNDYNAFSGPPATPTGPSYHHHGDQNGDNLPPVGFEGIGNQKDQDTATTTGIKLVDRDSPVPPILHKHSDDESHQINIKSGEVRYLYSCVISMTTFNAVLLEVNFCLALFCFRGF